MFFNSLGANERQKLIVLTESDDSQDVPESAANCAQAVALRHNRRDESVGMRLAGLIIVSFVLIRCATQPAVHSPATAEATQRTAIEAYFAAFKSGDFSRVPLSDDVVLVATHSLRGAEQLRSELRSMASVTRAVTIRRLAVTGDHGCAEVTWEGNDGKQRDFADCFEFANGQITAVRVYVPPAPRPGT